MPRIIIRQGCFHGTNVVNRRKKTVLKVVTRPARIKPMRYICDQLSKVHLERKKYGPGQHPVRENKRDGEGNQ